MFVTMSWQIHCMPSREMRENSRCCLFVVFWLGFPTQFIFRGWFWLPASLTTPLKQLFFKNMDISSALYVVSVMGEGWGG